MKNIRYNPKSKFIKVRCQVRRQAKRQTFAINAQSATRLICNPQVSEQRR